jgi:hypothetical protein
MFMLSQKIAPNELYTIIWEAACTALMPVMIILLLI